jgi:hypothetical protein
VGMEVQGELGCRMPGEGLGAECFYVFLWVLTSSTTCGRAVGNRVESMASRLLRCGRHVWNPNGTGNHELRGGCLLDGALDGEVVCYCNVTFDAISRRDGSCVPSNCSHI